MVNCGQMGDLYIYIYIYIYVVTVHNNDEQYVESKRERYIDLTWFDNLPTSTKESSYTFLY